jgi:hypothetical protein
MAPPVAPQILIVLFLIYLFDNIIQLISLRNYGIMEGGN